MTRADARDAIIVLQLLPLAVVLFAVAAVLMGWRR